MKRGITIADIDPKCLARITPTLRQPGNIEIDTAGKLVPAKKDGAPLPGFGKGVLDEPWPAPAIKTKKPREMTKTEREFSMMLEAQKRSGEILHWEYEGIKLKIGDPCCWFCPDFLAILPNGTLRFVETKGPFIHEDSLVKWKCAKHKFQHFQFQLWQKQKNVGWVQLYR